LILAAWDRSTSFVVVVVAAAAAAAVFVVVFAQLVWVELFSFRCLKNQGSPAFLLVRRG